MNLALTGPGPWQVGLTLTGGVGMVVLAYHLKLSGKVWLFLGGAIVGGYLGYLIDSKQQ